MTTTTTSTTTMAATETTRTTMANETMPSTTSTISTGDDDERKGRDMSDLINMLETATEDELPNWCPISMDGQTSSSEFSSVGLDFKTKEHKNPTIIALICTNT